jgi:hypothetical protein
MGHHSKRESSASVSIPTATANIVAIAAAYLHRYAMEGLPFVF